MIRTETAKESVNGLFGTFSYPKFDTLLYLSFAIQRLAIFICAVVYYKLLSILIFLNGIFLYFNSS